MLSAGVWSHVTLTSFFFGGVDGTAIIVYVPIILLVGWLVGARASVLVAALTVATTLSSSSSRWRVPCRRRRAAARQVGRAVRRVRAVGRAPAGGRAIIRRRLEEVHSSAPSRACSPRPPTASWRSIATDASSGQPSLRRVVADSPTSSRAATIGRFSTSWQGSCVIRGLPRHG
jgi:hypothetical protein